MSAPYGLGLLTFINPFNSTEACLAGQSHSMDSGKVLGEVREKKVDEYEL